MLLGAFFATVERMAWDVLAQLEQDGTVMNERVDHFFLPDGKQVDVRVAGYFEVVGDKVRRWRGLLRHRAAVAHPACSGRARPARLGAADRRNWPVPAVTPPSTGNATPVTNEASSLSRNATTAAISRVSPNRPIGMWVRISS